MQHDVSLHDSRYDPEVTLRPLTTGDIAALCALAADCGDELRHMGTSPTGPAYYQAALDAPNQMPFVLLVNGELAGCTRYGDIRAADSGLEIGWTWMHPRWYGSGVNRRMKRLLLAHAFETMHMERVQLKTDIRNERSQRAIARLGAVREGVLRAHMRRLDGTMRDTVMFSLTRAEWPEVKSRLGDVNSG